MKLNFDLFFEYVSMDSVPVENSTLFVDQGVNFVDDYDGVDTRNGEIDSFSMFSSLSNAEESSICKFFFVF